MSYVVPIKPLEPSQLVVTSGMAGRRKVVRVHLGSNTVEMDPYRAELLAKTLMTMADLAWKQ